MKICERKSTLTYKAKQPGTSLKTLMTSSSAFSTPPVTLNRSNTNDNAPPPVEAAEAAILMEAAASDQIRARINLSRRPNPSPSNARQPMRRTTPGRNASTVERKATSIATTQSQINPDETTVSPPCANALKLRKPLKGTVSMSSLITWSQPEMMRTSI